MQFTFFWKFSEHYESLTRKIPYICGKFQINLRYNFYILFYFSLWREGDPFQIKIVLWWTLKIIQNITLENIDIFYGKPGKVGEFYLWLPADTLNNALSTYEPAFNKNNSWFDADFSNARTCFELISDCNTSITINLRLLNYNIQKL